MKREASLLGTYGHPSPLSLQPELAGTGVPFFHTPLPSPHPHVLEEQARQTVRRSFDAAFPAAYSSGFAEPTDQRYQSVSGVQPMYSPSALHSALYSSGPTFMNAGPATPRQQAHLQGLHQVPTLQQVPKAKRARARKAAKSHDPRTGHDKAADEASTKAASPLAAPAEQPATQQGDFSYESMGDTEDFSFHFGQNETFDFDGQGFFDNVDSQSFDSFEEFFNLPCSQET